MPNAIETVSTITAKGQTTIPKSVRKALGVDYGGRIAFRVSRGAVTVSRAEDDEDPALGGFLDLLERDIQARPEALEPLTPALAKRLAALVGEVPVDLDAPIEGDTAI